MYGISNHFVGLNQEYRSRYHSPRGIEDCKKCMQGIKLIDLPYPTHEGWDTGDYNENYLCRAIEYWYGAAKYFTPYGNERNVILQTYLAMKRKGLN